MSDGMEWERCPMHGPMCSGTICCCRDKHPGYDETTDTAPEFVTKASGEETEFSSGMKRDSNKGKPRFDLIVPEGVPYQEQLLYRFAALMARGADLRGDRNWENADSEADLSRFRESAFRHFFQWYCGETDEDHLVGFLFNAQGAEFVKRKLRSRTEESIATGLMQLKKPPAE